MAFYLGIDGGATKTTCAVGDEKSILGTATSGGSSVIRVGEAQARASIQAAILGACAAAKVDPRGVDSTCVGITGASVPEVREAVRRFIAEIATGTVIVVGDQQITLEAALEGTPGVVVESGSGSFAFGRNQAGQTARAGGHGCQISDEGSGYWIGRTAITDALRAFDEGSETRFLTHLAQALGAESRDSLVKIANANPTPDFAILFPVAAQTAEAGDLIAIGVLKRAGAELAKIASIVIGKLWQERDTVRVAVVGGVFHNSSIVRHEFEKALHAVHKEVEVSLSFVDPVIGALALARRAADISAAGT